LLTGDISVNREAAVVVMTTEVYRNMLYGTILGDVRTNLDNVASVIIDECHYMNDPDRGTVWEELVIYSPKTMQLVALSATVANSEELTQWFEKVHGPTHLVRSEHRSVPLDFFYYYDGVLYSLLNRKRKLNPQLRSIVENAKSRREEKLSREERMQRREAKRAMYYPERIVRAMEREKMLPAIFFLFSRKRCDEAVQSSDKSVTLTLEEKERLNQAIDQALDEHPSLRDNPHLRYLRQGVAAHHAGLLPMWKMLVENLFQQGLIKVVYATETLAAGINMPARSTVISAIAKFSDEGLRPMTASEFLQMSGRAGRRGMDKRGNVVVVCHPNEPVEQAAELAAAPADPLVSHFTPCYGMVLNLLQRHTMDEAKELIERSFGQFVADTCQQSWTDMIGEIDAQLAERDAGGACPEGKQGDVAHWKALSKKVSNIGQKAHTCHTALRDNALPGYKEAAEAASDELRAAKAELAGYPCTKCERRADCQEWQRERQKLVIRRKDLQNQLKMAQTSYWEQFKNLVSVLQRVGYLDESHRVMSDGLMASSLRATNVLFLNEVALSGVLEELEPVEVPGVISALVLGDSRSMPEFPMRPCRNADDVIEAICSIADKVEELQKRYSVSVPVWVNSTYAGLVEYWCRGANWEELRDYLGWEEGDMMRLLRRTLDVLQQFVHAPGMSEAVVSRCQEAIECLDRDEVSEAAMWSE
ncbi:DEAD/DEAH box helicase, partial [bacterium]|nr:DEAD/DEAH box helicase [bacterium]